MNISYIKKTYALTDNGFSLIELFIVIAMLIVLITIAFPFGSKMIQKYYIENEIKKMHSEFMSIRLKAMQRNRMHFIVLNAGGYSVYEDTSPAPDGNGTLETSGTADALILNSQIKYTLAYSLTSGSVLSFGKDGQIGNVTEGSYSRLIPASTVSPDYDCLRLSATRINLGKFNGTTCVAK